MDVERGDCYSAACPAREVLGHVTGRWGGLVLGALTHGTRRYSELRARIEGISEKMLAQTLRDLERDGLVLRRQYPTVPPRVDYTLTPGGMEVAQRVESLIGWLQEHVHELVAAQRMHESNKVAAMDQR
jgi:DNA-binding HxlR family transcriptional regulator